MRDLAAFMAAVPVGAMVPREPAAAVKASRALLSVARSMMREVNAGSAVKDAR